MTANKEIDEIIKKTLEERKSSLSLASQGLTTLPEAVREMDWLQVLDISSNELTELPEWLVELPMLREIDVSYNELEKLPQSLASLDNLRKLVVSANKLKAFPSVVLSLSGLEQLQCGNNNIDKIPDDICNLRNLRVLQLWSNRISAIPSAIGQLSALSELNLGGNRLSSLPVSLAELRNLQILYIWGNQLTALPPVIFALEGLIQLSILRNRIEQLPDEIALLRELRNLYAGENLITEIPAALRKLTKLQALHLSENKITEIPAWIDELRNLKDLSLDSNLIQEVPSSLGNLKALNRLDLGSNAIFTLPESITSLDKLRSLRISQNGLTMLPENLGRLAKLELLDAEKNNLISLPASVGALGKLAVLNLARNEIEEIPDNLRRCKGLRIIDIAYNKLKALPTWLVDLSLRELWLQGNRDLGLSAAVTGTYLEAHRRHQVSPKPVQALLDAYFALNARDGQELNEIKLVLVGRGAAGKTSIARRLVRDKFSLKQKETQGVDITKWELSCGENCKVRVNIWDFAGQVVTHSTHQFFLSESSVYVLVLTGREDMQKNDAEYWLRLIRAFSTDEEGAVSPVIIALNKFAAHPFKIDRLALKEKYPFIVDFVETDCETGQGIADLRHLLADVVGQMKIIREKFKLSWWQIKKAIERSQRKLNYLSYAGFQQMCGKNGETEPERQRFLADVFHALGVALNYGRDERLRDATVLNPRWVTDGIYKLLREAVPDDGSALLSMNAARQVLNNEPEEMQRYLVDLMRRFDLAFPLNGSEDQWLVPQRLPAEQPELNPYWKEPKEATRLRFIYTVIPEGLLPRFICRTHPLSENPDDESTSLPRWINGVVLADRDARALVRVDPEERTINITVSGEREARLTLLGVIQSDFHTIHADIKGLDPREELEIEDSRGVFVPVRTLLADEAKRNPSSASTPTGTLQLDPTKELNRLSEQSARSLHAWRPRVFISYSSADARSLDQLLVRLKPLHATHGLLDSWSDRCLPPGADWDGEIREELERADVVLLLVSARFIASDYIRGVEVKRAMERHAKGECQVVPIVLEKTDWESECFGKCNSLPRKGLPIRDFKPQGNGWFEVGKELRELLERIKKSKSDGRDG
ncbi:MAG TPA: COR domain-containing protein [Noviherbaspirillum sp.]|nr:COR domain-containing protein [Noviherbaspirillum sp.]